MIPLARHIRDTASIADGWIVGRLVIEDGVFIQKEDGELVPVPIDAIVEVAMDGGHWYRLRPEDPGQKTPEGWPLFAGADARMMKVERGL